MSFDRRDFIVGSAFGALGLLSGCGGRSAPPTEAGSIYPLLAEAAERLLRLFPERATTLGLDEGSPATQK